MSQEISKPQNQSETDTSSSANQANSNDVQGMESSGKSENLPITPIIGGTMGAIGIILLLQGLIGTTANYHLSDNININLWWGLVLIVFGIIMWGGNFLVVRRRKAS